MKVKILTSGALVDEKEGTRAGLADEVEVSKERAEYLIGIGAATPVNDSDREKTSDLEELGRPEPLTGGATTTQQPTPDSARRPVARKPAQGASKTEKK